jgi:hypothetical protein
MTEAVDEQVSHKPSSKGDSERQQQRPRRRALWSVRSTPAPPPPTEFRDPGPLDQRQLLRRRRYASAQLSLLSAQYVKVRGDLLVSVGDDDLSKGDGRKRRYAMRCADYLASAKRELESRDPNFVVCSNLLFLADVTLVWLYPKEMLDLRCQAALARLKQLKSNYRAPHYESGMARAHRNQDDRFARSALEDALNYLHQVEQVGLIEDDLQVTRLRSLIVYIGGAFVILMLSVPYITIRLGSGIEGWPVVDFGREWLTQAVSAAAVSALGAVGGIFSGLISTRDSRATLIEYRSSMLKLALKPLVGAVASLTLYLLLSWQILTGVQVTNGGTFLLVGFLAGFSERYFLRLLAGSTPEERAEELSRFSPYERGIWPSSEASSWDVDKEVTALSDERPQGDSTTIQKTAKDEATQGKTADG